MPKRQRSSIPHMTSGGSTNPSGEPNIDGWLRPCVMGCLLAVQLGCYIATLHPSVPGGDSGELISVAHVGGVPHPPGYPLYTMIVHGFTTVVPFGSPAFRANLFSAICASGAGLLLHCTAVELTGSVASGIFAVAVFNFSRLQWLYAITGEVFALNNLLVTFLIYNVVQYHKIPSVWRGCHVAFISGLALSNQHTAILFIVIIAPWVLYRSSSTGVLSWSTVVLLTFSGLAGLMPYAYVPWSAHRNIAPLTWGDQRTLSGFFIHLLRREYGTFDLAKGGREAVSFWRAVQAHLLSLASETFYVCPLLSVAGILLPPRRRGMKQVHVILAICLAFYNAFFNWRANLDLSNRLLAGVQERFWMQPNLCFALFAALGFSQLLDRFLSAPRRQFVGLFLATALLSAQVSKNFNALDESSNFFVRDFGESLLGGLPPNSILLTMGDLPGNAARYLQKCEGFRTDVRVIDLEMMTMDWYLPMTGWTFPGVVFPSKIQRYSFGPEFFDMKKFFDANIDNFDIFVYENLNPEDTSWVADFEVWRHGVTRAIKRKGTRLNASAWLASALPATPNHTLPDPVKYDDRTWEYVVYESAIASGVHLAMFFESRAAAASTPQEKIALYTAAATVYQSLFSQSVFDGHRLPFWHKNAGLASYNLVTLTQDKKHLSEMKRHWQAYLDSNPDDPQIKDIIAIIRAPS